MVWGEADSQKRIRAPILVKVWRGGKAGLAEKGKRESFFEIERRLEGDRLAVPPRCSSFQA